MNYLAHSYLSFTEGQLVGNMIADFIKNNERDRYPKEIQKGIKLHRFIDSFTDTHPSISEAKKVFSPLVRLYSGAFIDVCFDYFLAHQLEESELKQHAQSTYATLWKYEEHLPHHFKTMLERMEKDDWLSNYRNDQGIQYSIQNVLNKAKYLDKNLEVFDLFIKHKTLLNQYFTSFFPELFKACKQNLSNFSTY